MKSKENAASPKVATPHYTLDIKGWNPMETAPLKEGVMLLVKLKVIREQNRVGPIRMVRRRARFWKEGSGSNLWRDKDFVGWLPLPE